MIYYNTAMDDGMTAMTVIYTFLLGELIIIDK